MKIKIRHLLFLVLGLALASARAQETAEILTPKPPPTPRINGPSIFGVRPGSPLVYRIPATGRRPMEFSVRKLPEGLRVDAATGDITGKLSSEGKYKKCCCPPKTPWGRATRNSASSSATPFRSRPPWVGIVGIAGAPASPPIKCCKAPAAWPNPV